MKHMPSVSHWHKENRDQSQTNRPSNAQVLYLWPAGSSKSALLSCHGNRSAEAPKGKGRGEGRWRRHLGGFSRKDHLFLSPKPGWGGGGVGAAGEENREEMGIWGLEKEGR